MICPRCRANVASGKKFCGDCGSPMPWICGGCGGENPSDKRFCGDCGAAMGGATAAGSTPGGAPVAREAPAAPAPAAAERRQLTVLFADLVGSTLLGTRLDPEDLREVINAYHGCVTGIAVRFDGFVARYMGDGLLVYFGYPQAHEGDAERAVRAGLAMVEAVRQLDTVAGPPGTLSVRVSIATGLVVVGDLIGSGSSQESPVVGDTPNLGARLQTIAEPGMVVIADATRRLIGGLFEYKELGPQQLKGRDAAVEAWAVLGESSIDSRFEALRPGQLALVGRSDEIELMLRRWEQAKAGEGRVMLLSGQPGIGKSRLIAALEHEIRDAPHVRVRFVCSLHYQDTPLHPVIRQMERAANFQRGDSASAKLEKLRRSLAAAQLSEADITLLADLLSVPRAPGDPPPMAVSPQRMREMIFSVLLRRLESLSRQAPVLTVVEDIHWADPTTLDLLDPLVAMIEQMPMLLVVTTRPETQPIWADRPEVTTQVLNGLSRRQTARMIREAAGDRILPEEVVERITARSDGIPLFIEELTKTVLERTLLRESDASRMEAISVDAVPSSLQDSLAARLDALYGGKEIAQIGAVIGREFSFEMLQTLSGLPAKQLEQSLGELLQTGLVTARGRPPVATYVFKHALVQDVAYGSMLRDRRRSIHLRLAETLEKDPGTVAAEPQLIAWHFSEAGAFNEAINYYLKAAEGTTGRFALAEKVSHLRKGLDQLPNLPATEDTLRRELTLQVALGRALIDHDGSGRDQVIMAYDRAREICVVLDATKQLLRVHDGLLNFHFTRSDARTVLHHVGEMLEIARRTGDPQAFLVARRSAGYGNLLLGRLDEAREAMELMLEVYDRERDGPHAGLTTRDPKVSVCTLLGICLTAMGFADSGAEMSMQGVRHAEALDHPVTLILGLRRASVQRMMQRDPKGVMELSARLAAINARCETYLGTREGAIFECWAQLQQRHVPALLKRMQASVDELDNAKFWAILPFFMASLAELKGKYGDPVGVATLLDRASRLTTDTDERWCEAEILRLRARYCARDHDEALELLDRAIGIARSQRATLWELRSASCLAELWRARGRHADASDVLTPVHARFTEGFEIPDVAAARALLDELRQTAPAG
jgi:class 3 adenylate cyclase/tetratricopeptide (TPR) repeat protein